MFLCALARDQRAHDTAASVYILSEIAVHSQAPREEQRAAYVKLLEILECIRNTKMSEKFNIEEVCLPYESGSWPGGYNSPDTFLC